MLFGLKPTDFVTYVLTVTSLSAVAALASFLPARRAARLDPMVALSRWNHLKTELVWAQDCGKLHW